MVTVQLALVLQFGKAPLPQRLVGGDGDGVGEIQAARLVDHGYAQGSFGKAHEHMLGQAARLLAEEQKGVVGESHVAVDMGALSGKECQ